MEEVGDRLDGGCHLSWHGELPWGSNDLTSEKPVLHYITHTYSCRTPARSERVTGGHVQTDEIPASTGRSPQPRAHSECARNARESPPIFHIPASPAAAQRGISAAEGRARVRSGATGGAGDAQPPSRERDIPFPSCPKSSPRARGGRPRRSPDSAGRRTAPRFFSGRLGVPHAKITLHFAKSWIFPLAREEPAFSGKAKYEHSNEYSRTKRETAVGATATKLRERRHHFHRSWKCYLVEPARRAG